MRQAVQKYAYTLVELVVAVSISAVVLVIIFFFITDTLIQLAETEKNSRFLTSFSRFTSQFQAYSSSFSQPYILVNNTSSGGFDVILLERDAVSDAVLWAVLDKQTLRPIANSEFGTYLESVVGYRTLSPLEVGDLKTTPANVYQLDFFGDKVFEGFTLKNMQAKLFNSGAILSLNLDISRVFETEKVGLLWQSLDKTDIFPVVLNY